MRAVTVEKRSLGESASFTGQIHPRDEAALAFRIGGRMIDRPVNIGDRVTAGQTIARLEPLDEENAQRSAEAALSSARGVLARAQNDFDRHQTLLRQGHTTRTRFDQAEQELRTAQAQVQDAEAQLQIATDRVGFTELAADADGVITRIGAEPGEVVEAGRMIAQVARGEARDAVFDIPSSILRAAPPGSDIAIRLVYDPAVVATGSVREVAPKANPVTRNFQVRVGLQSVPSAMRLGSTVTGTIALREATAISVPAAALTTVDNRPAVWVVDPTAMTVALKPVEVLRYEPEHVVISSGLESGDIVVTAGVQALYPGRKVRLLGAAS